MLRDRQILQFVSQGEITEEEECCIYSPPMMIVIWLTTKTS